MASLLKRTHERAEPPSQHVPEIPGHLNDVVVRCLETEADLRYQSADAVLADLKTGHGPRAHTAFSRISYTLRRTAPSTKWLAAGLVSVVLILAAMTSTGRLGWWSSESGSASPGAAVEIEPTTMAILPFLNGSGDEGLDWLGPSLAEMLRTGVGQSSRAANRPRGSDWRDHR